MWLEGVAPLRYLWLDGAMKTPTTTDYIDTLAGSGFFPSDDAEVPAGVVLPRWVPSRFEAIRIISRDEMLTAGYREDELVLTRCGILNGVPAEMLRFPAPDGELSPLTVVAFEAVVEIWAAS